MIDATSFGAVGDGVTDNHGPLQEAVDHVSSSGGGRVLLPSGNYLPSKTLDLKPGVMLAGDSPGAPTSATIRGTRIAPSGPGLQAI